MNVKPKKQFGQHFLTNPEVTQNIIQQIQSFDFPVLEIGPGKGILTQSLSSKGKFKCVEIDRESQDYLIENKIVTDDQLLKGDFLRLEVSRIFDGEEFMLAGNFPYNISTQIVFKLIESRDKIPVMIGMFQKEVADRICSLHGSKQYGILSVLGQAYFSAKTLFYVEPDSFYPPPKVRSSVIILERTQTEIEVPYSDLHRVVKMAFNHRRKTIKNSLGLLISGIPNFNHPFLKLRPEQLSVQDFIDLTKALYNTPN